MIQLDAEFYGFRGKRNVITFITDAEKDPVVLGFSLVDEGAPGFPVRPKDDMDVKFLQMKVWKQQAERFLRANWLYAQHRKMK